MLPYKNNKKYIYALEVNKYLLGLLKLQKTNSKIKSIIPFGYSDKLPFISKYSITSDNKFKLTSSNQKIHFIRASYLRSKIIKDLYFLIIEEKKKRKPSEIFNFYQWFDKKVYNYYTITNGYIYASGFEPSSLTAKKFVVLKHSLVIIT